MTTKEWAFGDRVVHIRRPEWGAGVVTAAAKDNHEGKPCQRLTIRFDRVGVKTLSTALADLTPADQAPPPSTPENGEDSDWLAKLSGDSLEDKFTKLPEPCTDPFTTSSSRLKASLGLYRFTDSGASLLDWAAAQTGLKDPMTRFNRHELEVHFQKFAFVRDEHLRKLALEMKKKDPAELSSLVRSAPPGAHQVLRRLDIGR